MENQWAVVKGESRGEATVPLQRHIEAAVSMQKQLPPPGRDDWGPVYGRAPLEVGGIVKQLQSPGFKTQQKLP